ncbi:unnamed protein product, partial [Meganyctiphanes norvegica]
DPVSKPTVTDDSGLALRSGVVGPYHVGQYLKLACLTKHGFPLPNVTWWRDGELIDDHCEVHGPKIVRNDLEIKNLTWTWDNVTLTCRAENYKLRPATAVALRLLVISLPKTVVLTGSKIGLAGHELLLQCVSEGSRPPAILNWTIDSEVLKPNKKFQNTQYGESTTSTLRLQVQKEDDGRHISCSAANPSSPQSVINNHTIITVHYPPTVEVELGATLQIRDLKEGEDVFFTCKVKANPPVTSISWYLEDQQQVQNVSMGVIVSDNTLVLQRVQVTQMGNYRCQAKNQVGSSRSTPVLLSLKYAPTCETAPTTYFIYDKPINVTCRVSANPQATSVQWRWNGSYDAIATLPVPGAGEGEAAAQLTVFPSKYQEDRGLACWAANAIGRQAVPCSFNIKVAQMQAPLSSCRLANITASSLSVTCSEAINGRVPGTTLYTAEVYLENGTLFANVTSPKPSFNVSQLDAGTRYHIQVFVNQGPVTSEPVVVEAYTSRDAVRRETEPEALVPSEDSFPIWAVMLGVVLTGITLGAIITLQLLIRCYKKRRRRCKNSDKSSPSQTSQINEDSNPDVVPTSDTAVVIASNEGDLVAISLCQAPDAGAVAGAATVIYSKQYQAQLHRGQTHNAPGSSYQQQAATMRTSREHIDIVELNT